MTDNRRDKVGLFMLAGLSIGLIGAIAILSFFKGLPRDAETLLGMVVTGLLLFARDIIASIRQAWQDVQMGKMGDQLANSTPIPANDSVPAGVEEAAEQVAEAAADEAAIITGASDR